MKDTDTHLDEEQLVLSLVDEDDLPETRRKHLRDCPACLKKKKSLTAELDHLGKMADEFAPVPNRRPNVEFPEPRRLSSRIPIFAGGLAVSVLIVFLFGLVLFTDTSRRHIDAGQATQKDAGLHLVGELWDNSTLSVYYRDMAPGSYSYFDNDFLEFVAPLEEHSDSV